MENKIIWITGASSGIGLSAVTKFLSNGAYVIATSKNKKKLNKLESHDNLHLEAGDLTNIDICHAIVDRIVKKYGRIDIVVNNAGTNIEHRSLSALTPSGIDELIDTNLKSLFYITTSVLPIMRRQRYGQFIHISSWTARWNLKVLGAAYSAAKQGILALNTSINQEEQLNGIKSSVILPAEVNTPMLMDREEPLTSKEKNKMLKASQVADSIFYIASTPNNVVINELVISPLGNRYYTE
jgi:NADP-dependent 3-hydroxy acid dehydrogenase YdfG